MKSDSPGANTEKANVYNPTNRYDDLFPVRIPLELDKNPSIKDMQTLQQENSDMAIKRAWDWKKKNLRDNDLRGYARLRKGFVGRLR